MIDASLFYFFSALVLGGGILTITQRNAVMSAVCLIVSLLGVAGIFLLLGAEFLFVAQLILYVGGVVLLFLFVIMLVNLEAAAQVSQFRKSWPLVMLAGLGLAAELLFLLFRADRIEAAPVAILPPNTEALADVLFSQYLVAFELTSIVLLVAIVGAVWMGQTRKAQ